MSISINSPDGRSLAETRRIDVHGLPGIGGYTLVINFPFSITAPLTDTYLHNLSIRVDWGDGCQRMIGTAIPEQSQPVRITTGCNQLTIGFRLLLSPSQIEAIEALRNGGDINFSIWFLSNVYQEDKHLSIQQQGKFNVIQQQWVEALNRMEYCRSFLYELKMPFVDNEQEPAMELVEKAQYYLLRGDYDACVGECRKLCEAYPLSDVDDKVLKTGRKKYKGAREERESMDLPERMLVLRDALTNVTHLSHHHSCSNDYSRDQARSILGATISILSASISGNLL